MQFAMQNGFVVFNLNQQKVFAGIVAASCQATYIVYG
jgi:hypothetical protein